MIEVNKKKMHVHKNPFATAVIIIKNHYTNALNYKKVEKYKLLLKIIALIKKKIFAN